MSNDRSGKYFGSLIVAGCLALATPLAAAPAASEAPSASATVAVQQVRTPPTGRDQAAMVLVGTALIGLAAAVRRAAA